MPFPLRTATVVLSVLAAASSAHAQTDPKAETDVIDVDADGGEADEEVADDLTEEVADDLTEEDDVIDVLITGQKEEAEKTTPSSDNRLAPRDVTRVPGAFGDAFRAIDALPGVSPMASGLPHLFVRGATPSGSGYFIDGIRVPFLFHLAIGPSVINPAIVDDVRFYGGAYPARFGRNIGGIVDASTRAPSKRLRLEGQIRLFDAGAYAEVPLFDNKLSLMAGGRYSYTAPILSLVAPNTSLSYWDYQGAAWYHLSRYERVGVFAFGSRDHLGQVPDGEEEEKELFGVEFHRVHARIERQAHRRADGHLSTYARLGFTFGIDRSNLNEEAIADSRNYTLSNDVDVFIASWLRLRGGLSLRADEYDIDTKSEEEEKEEMMMMAEEEEDEFDFKFREAFKSRSAGVAGAYLDFPLRPFDWLQVVPGFRVDIYAEDSETQVAIDPRGMLRLKPTSWLTMLSAVGLTHQKPSLLVSIPGLDPIGLGDGLQEALQVQQTFELAFPAEVGASLTGFWHRYDKMTDLSATCAANVEKCNATDRVGGQSYGLEVLIRRSLSTNVGGIIGYTLSYSERELEDGTTFTADFDRTHVFNIAIGVDLTRGWHAGARFSTYSGRPFSLLKFDNAEKPNEATLIGQRNSLRRPPFYRLDVRLEKRWVIADAGWISLVLEGFNVTGKTELVDFDCRVAEQAGNQTGLTCGGQEIGPISIPSIGVSGGY